jgi:replicative DNA helicase
MKLFSYQASLSKYQDAISQAKEAPKFGYKAINDMIPGLLPGSLTVLAGATSMGKTSFLANCDYHMAVIQRKNVLFFSLESGHSVAGVIEKMSGVNEIDNLRIVKPERQIAYEEVESIVKENLHHADVVIIDHLHYLLQIKNNVPVQANIGELVRQIQILAHSLEIPIIIVSHVRKLSTETSVPGLNDLKDSSALYQDPSNVFIIHRFKKEVLNVAVGGKEQVLTNNGLLIVAKNRDFGKTGTLKLDFDEEKMAFAVGGEWL